MSDIYFGGRPKVTKYMKIKVNNHMLEEDILQDALCLKAKFYSILVSQYFDCILHSMDVDHLLKLLIHPSSTLLTTYYTDFPLQIRKRRVISYKNKY